MDIEKLRQKTLNLTNMASSCRKILMMNLLLFCSNGLKQKKNVLSKRVRLSVARSLVLLIRSIMRTCRLRCRVRGCGAGWKILQFLSKIALIQQPKMKERDTLWCVLLNITDEGTIDLLEFGVFIEFLRKFIEQNANVRDEFLKFDRYNIRKRMHLLEMLLSIREE